MTASSNCVRSLSSLGLMAAQLPFSFTLAKVAAAVVIGLLAGGAVLILERMGYLANPLRADYAACGTSCATSCGGPADLRPHWRFWHQAERRTLFATEARDVGLFLTKWLLLAFALEKKVVGVPPGSMNSGRRVVSPCRIQFS